MNAQLNSEVLYPSQFHGSFRSQKDQAITAAAQRIFLDKGFDGASMDDIALAASVSKRTIYNRYASKADLFGAVAVQACEKIISFDFQLPLDVDIRTNLTNVGHHLLNGYLQPDAIALRRLVTFQADRTPEIGRAYSVHALKPIFNCMFAYFTSLAERGEFSTIIPAKDAAWLFLSLACQPLDSRIMLGGYKPGDLDMEIDEQVQKGVEKFLLLARL